VKIHNIVKAHEDQGGFYERRYAVGATMPAPGILQSLNFDPGNHDPRSGRGANRAKPHCRFQTPDRLVGFEIRIIVSTSSRNSARGIGQLRLI
jgi:hypothetical protein